jgi:hypothetical protein
MHNYLKHIVVFLSFISLYIFCKLFLPQFNLLTTIIIAVLLSHYITNYVISENWIAKVVRFILGKDF